MSEGEGRGRATAWAILALIGIAVVGERALNGKPRLATPRESGKSNRADPSSGDGDAAAGGGGRGRRADQPSDVPARGWIDILKRTMAEFSDDRVLSVAASVTYYTLLAIFPAITALVSLYGLMANPSNVSHQLDALSGVLPGGATQIVGDQMQHVATQATGALGVGFVIGLLVALWSASAGMKALFDAMNVVYDEKEERGFIKLSAQALAFTLGAIVFLLLGVGAVVALPVALNYLGLGNVTELLMRVLRWPALLVITALALAVLYRFGPSRAKAEWRWISWGSVLAAVLWIIVSLLFSWYVQNFGSYNKTYGSLGAVIGFMTWIWLSTTIFLLGAELNAEIEHQTARDTTAGRNKPLGTRGATMADTVGRPQ